ncbi:MAG: RNA methyltransferase [Bacteroidetes bacterium]|nr:RNA methyltransferase [Bacteroidota bacterium]
MQGLYEDFYKRMHHQLGGEASSLIASLQGPSPISIRIHPEKDNGLFRDATKVSWCSQGRYLKDRPVFTLDPLFHAGCYYVQEAGSMLIESILRDVIGDLKTANVLDLCAAPGGKTTHLISLLSKDCNIICNEIIPGRNKILRHNLAKWGYSNSIVTQNEAKDIANSTVLFDLIVVDAPCSGEGLFRKDPEAIREWSPEQVDVCAARQTNILEDIIPALKPGGYLLYSTCTYEPSENDQQIERLLLHHPFINITPPAPEGIVATTHGWQSFPHKVAAEGFYCCLLQYEGTSSKKVNIEQKFKTDRSFNKGLWLKEPDKFEVVQQEEYLNAATPAILSLTKALARKCYIRQSGLPLGQTKGNDFIPAPELAMSLQLKSDTPACSLQLKEVLHFLRGDSIIAESEMEGWHLINFEGHALGWAKKIRQRWNNYYPKDWRIRMAIPEK